MPENEKSEQMKNLLHALEEHEKKRENGEYARELQQEEENFAAGGGYVITQPCIATKDAACVDACPVDCIHPTPGEPGFETAEMLYINANECICCNACEPACPVNAIFEASAVPKEWRHYIKINADFFKN